MRKYGESMVVLSFQVQFRREMSPGNAYKARAKAFKMPVGLVGEDVKVAC